MRFFSLMICVCAVLTFLFGGFQFCAIFEPELNKLNVSEIKYDSTDEAIHKNTLAFKMIDLDLSRGITSRDTAIKAKQNVAFFFKTATNECSGKQGKELALCANNVLGEYFYYSPSDEVSNNYAKQQSDCDLNSYLLYDFLNAKGVKTHILYSPGHAFISVMDKAGGVVNIETTKNNNKGGEAMMNDDLYAKTNDSYYYTPILGDEAFTVYQALMYHLSTDKNYIESLPNVKINPIMSDFYYRHLQLSKKISPSDMDDVKRLLENDGASTEKRLIIADWYLSQGKKDEAKSYIRMINNPLCYEECVMLKIASKEWPSIAEPIYKAYKVIAKEKASAYNFIIFLGFVCAGCLLVLFVFFLKNNSKSANCYCEHKVRNR